MDNFIMQQDELNSSSFLDKVGVSGPDDNIGVDCRMQHSGNVSQCVENEVGDIPGIGGFPDSEHVFPDVFVDIPMSDNTSTVSGANESLPSVLDNHDHQTDTEDDEDKEDLSYDLQQGLRILSEIMSDSNKALNWPFINAVDANAPGCEDYYEKVEKPMWLWKMRRKFAAHEYSTITEFISDMRTMLENCYRFNGPDHPISKKGQKLETVLEQKLALLSRDLREKTSIAATSGNKNLGKTQFSALGGSRRRKAIVPHDSTALLNQLRLEEKDKEREHRRLMMEERKKTQEDFIAGLQSWEDSLLSGGRLEELYAMWELPQIGHFLMLCCEPLNIGEVTQYELERCFLMPRESSTMQRIMTTLLSTPQQRSCLERKPYMPYKVWEEKLCAKIRNWYKIHREVQKDAHKVVVKLGIEEKFFEVLGPKNPLEKKKFHQLTYYQRVWIVKSLCDFVLEHHESLRETMESQPITEQREYLLGIDADGHSYLHFPQFCGADVRIYRQSPLEVPQMEKKPTIKNKAQYLELVHGNHKKKPKNKPVKKAKSPKPVVKESPVVSSPRCRDGRLRQNPKQRETLALAFDSSSCGSQSKASSIVNSDTSSDDDDDSSSNKTTTDQEEPPAKVKRSSPARRSTRTSLRRNLFEEEDQSSRDSTPANFVRRSLRKVIEESRKFTDVEKMSPKTKHSKDFEAKTPQKKFLPFSSWDSSPSMTSRDSSPAPNRVPSRSRRRTRGSLRKAVAACAMEDTVASSQNSDINEAQISDQAESLHDETMTESCMNAGNLSGTDSNHSHQSNADKHFDRGEDKACVSDKDVDGPEKHSDLDKGSCVDKKDHIASSELGLGSKPEKEVINGSLGDSETSVVPKEKLAEEDQSQLGQEEQRCLDSDNGTRSCVSIESKTKLSLQASAENGCIERDDRESKDNVISGVHCEYDDMKCCEISKLDQTTNCVSDIKYEVKGLTCGIHLKTEEPECKSFEMFETNSVEQMKCGELDTRHDVKMKEDLTAGTMDREATDVAKVKVETTDVKVLKAEVTKDVNGTADDLMDTDNEKKGVSEETEDATKESETTPNQTIDDAKEVESSIDQSKDALKENDGTLEEHMDTGVKENEEMSEECSELGETSKSGEQRKKSVSGESSGDEEWPEVKPDFDSFKLVVDSVESLRELVAQFDESIAKSKNTRVSSSKKKCVDDLHERLTLLLKELEPWETKLIAANRKARIKMRKELENYVEEVEKEPVKNVWGSDDEASETNEDTDSVMTEPASIPPEDPKPKTTPKPKKIPVEKPVVEESNNDSDIEFSTRGRLRKRRIIPNNIEDQGIKKRKKVPTTTTESKSVMSVVPNILQKSRTSSVSSTPSSSVTLTQLKQFAESQPPGMYSVGMMGNQPVLIKGLPQSSPKQILTSPLKPVNDVKASHSVGGGGDLGGSTKGTGFVVGGGVASGAGDTGQCASTGTMTIQALLARQAAEANLKPKAPTSSGNVLIAVSTQPATVLPQAVTLKSTAVNFSNPMALQTSSSSSAENSVSSSQVTVTESKGNVRFYSLNTVGKLDPGVIQQLLKQQDVKQKGIKSDANQAMWTQQPVLTSPNKSIAALPAVNFSSTSLQAKTTTVPQQTTVVPNNMDVSATPLVSVAAAKSLETTPISSSTPPNASPQEVLNPGLCNPQLRLLASPQKSKYAGNVTVKKLLQQALDVKKTGQARGENLLPQIRPITPKSVEQKPESSVPAQLNSDSVKVVPASANLQLQLAQPQVLQKATSTPQKVDFSGYQKAFQDSIKSPSGLPVQAVEKTAELTSDAQHAILSNATQTKQVGNVTHSENHIPAQLASQPQPLQMQPKVQPHGLLVPAQQLLPRGSQVQLGARLQLRQVLPSQPSQVATDPTQIPQILTSTQQMTNVSSTSENLQASSPVQYVNMASNLQPTLIIPSNLQQASQTLKEIGILAEQTKVNVAVSTQVASTSSATVPATVESSQVISPQPVAQPVAGRGTQANVQKITLEQLKVALAKKQAIDKAIKTVMTTVTTSLPTAQIKVVGSSPLQMPSRQSHRPVTMTTTAMKGPISVVPNIQSKKINNDEPQTISSPGPASGSIAHTNSQSISQLPGAAGSQNKPLALKLVPQNIMTEKGVVPGVVLPAGVVLPPAALSQMIAPKSEGGQGLLVVQQGKDGRITQLKLEPKPPKQTGVPEALKPPSSNVPAFKSSTVSPVASNIVQSSIPVTQLVQTPQFLHSTSVPNTQLASASMKLTSPQSTSVATTSVVQMVPQRQLLVQNPGQVIRNTGQVIQNPGQFVQNPGQVIQNRAQVVQNTGQVTQNRAQIIQHHGQVIQNAGQVIQNPGQVIQNPGQVIQNPGQVIQHPEQVIQNPGQVIQNPGQVIQNPGQVIQNPGQVIQNPGQTIQKPVQVIQNSGAVNCDPGVMIQGSAAVPQSPKLLLVNVNGQLMSAQGVQMANNNIQNQTKPVLVPSTNISPKVLQGPRIQLMAAPNNASNLTQNQAVVQVATSIPGSSHGQVSVGSAAPIRLAFANMAPQVLGATPGTSQLGNSAIHQLAGLAAIQQKLPVTSSN